jgi:glycine hydroxymethyltransferase
MPTPSRISSAANAARQPASPLPPFQWTEPVDPPLLTTRLHETHKALGARLVPFAGYDMPVWYTSVSEEHAAVRETAGLFDVSHMGVFDVSGPHALEFLNTVTGNDVASLAIGESQYSHFLMPDGAVIDDLMVYRVDPQNYLVVVNASNNDKDWAWLNAVNEGPRDDRRRPAVGAGPAFGCPARPARPAARSRLPGRYRPARPACGRYPHRPIGQRCRPSPSA